MKQKQSLQTSRKSTSNAPAKQSRKGVEGAARSTAKRSTGKKDYAGNAFTKSPSNKPSKAAARQMQAPTNLQNVTKSKKGNGLKVMFLGGVGEIGKNMTVFEYNNQIVIIDSGMSFPSYNMPGIDVVIPDFTYLVENQKKIRGLLITHGHEDHIGAVPFLAKKLDIKLKIFGTKLTLGLVENKLVEHGVLDKVTLVTVKEKETVALGHFEAEFIHVSHSVAGSVAISLKTPVGIVLHTGDFKIDYTPLGNEIMNLNRIAEIGREGVLLLLSESTNAEKPGYTMSEAVVKETMNQLFSDAKGRRIIIATFASNVDRLEMIMALAKQYKRKVAVSGRSMVKYIETACRVGQLSIDSDLLVDVDRIKGIDDGNLVILSTGSQGEPMSALTRMASGEFNKVKIGKNDTIILSSKPIVGNERDVYNVINNLYKLGATVIYSSLANVHVSGHACQEELKLIYTLVKPKYFIPVHGEYRHLKRHASLVEGLGHNPANLLIPEIGDTVYVDRNRLEFSDKVASGEVLVDGLCVSEGGNLALKDRLALAQDGILIVSLGVNKKTGALATKPQVIGKGCFINDEQGEVCVSELVQIIPQEVARMRKQDVTLPIQTIVTRVVRNYFRTKVKRNPVVVPVILEM